MNKWQVFPAWARILRGYKPFLSVEVTRECPLRCPGCYAYQEEHLNNGKALRQIEEIRGENLSEGILNLVRRYRPLHLSIVGGEPLLRLDEMEILLPKLNQLNVEVQIVTSAIRPIPQSWANLPNINLVVSVDGLPEEHDIRRAPASYDRILNNVKGHKIIVHCVVLRSMLSQPDYLGEFAEFWSRRPETRKGPRLACACIIGSMPTAPELLTASKIAAALKVTDTKVKKAIADAVVKALDQRFPGLAEQVEMVDVATPTTWERYTGNWRASFEGWLPTPANLSTEMRKTLPGLDSFYMVGQWVAPGGGLPSGVMTGRQVVQLMCHKDGKKFRVPDSH